MYSYMALIKLQQHMLYPSVFTVLTALEKRMVAIKKRTNYRLFK